MARFASSTRVFWWNKWRVGRSSSASVSYGAGPPCMSCRTDVVVLRQTAQYSVAVSLAASRPAATGTSVPWVSRGAGPERSPALREAGRLHRAVMKCAARVNSARRGRRILPGRTRKMKLTLMLAGTAAGREAQWPCVKAVSLGALRSVFAGRSDAGGLNARPLGERLVGQPRYSGRGRARYSGRARRSWTPRLNCRAWPTRWAVASWRRERAPRSPSPPVRSSR